MLIEYKNFKARLTYCPKTKTYHGEILGAEACISFQATSRQQAVQVMQNAVDAYLAQLQEFSWH